MAEQRNLSESPEPGQIFDPMSRFFRPEALDVGSPALVEHLAYRIHNNYVAKPDEWPSSIQKLLKSLDERLSQQALDPSSPPHITTYNERPAAIDVDENRRFRTARVGFKWRSIPIRMSFEIHPEHLTVTTVMDLSKWEDGKTTEDTVAKKLYNNIVDLDQRLLAKNIQIKSNKKSVAHPTVVNAPEAGFSNLHDAIFAGIWSDFHKEILGDHLRNSGAKLSECFAAGRGMVATLADDGIGKDEELKQFILLPGQDVEPDLTKPSRPFRKNVGLGKKTIAEDAAAASTVLSYMESPKDMKEVKHSASNFDENNLYITAHGADPTNTSDKPKKNAAATFFLLATHPNPGKLGFLVDRICTLATIRRAGIFDLMPITKASNALREVERKLQMAVKRQGQKTDDGRITDDGPTKDDLSDAYAGLNKAAVGKGKNKIQGGLVYRVDRSDTYLQYFNSLLADLSITRVGDFLSYLELGNRRLGDTYGSIATIGARFAALTRKINGYNRELQTKELATQVDVIAKLQTHMEKQTKLSTEYQGDNRSLLEIADFFAFVIAGTTALGAAFMECIPEATRKEMSILEGVGVFVGAFFVSMGLKDVSLTLKPRPGHRSRIRQGLKFADKTLTKRAEAVGMRLWEFQRSHPHIGADFKHCVKDIVARKVPEAIRYGLNKSGETIRIEYGWAKVAMLPAVDRLNQGRRKVQNLARKVRNFGREPGA